MSTITISRQEGSLGEEIAEKLAKILGYDLIIRSTVINEWLKEITTDHEFRMLTESPKFYHNISSKGITFKEYIEDLLIEKARDGGSVIMGMGSQIIFSGEPDTLNVRIVSSDQFRIKNTIGRYNVTPDGAENILRRGDRKHKRYIWALYGMDWADPAHYHLILNTDEINILDCLKIILTALFAITDAAATLDPQIKESINIFIETGQTPETIASPDPTPGESSRMPRFKHPAEVEFAKILDMYNIEWEYEPRTFPIEWDAEGNIKMAISPDFYLTKFDTYLEITTMDQRYVTTKNKKVRKLKELYPGINVRIVYKKDFHSLLDRFKMVMDDGRT